jgi:hypothetical protein
VEVLRLMAQRRGFAGGALREVEVEMVEEPGR